MGRRPARGEAPRPSQLLVAAFRFTWVFAPIDPASGTLLTHVQEDCQGLLAKEVCEALQWGTSLAGLLRLLHTANVAVELVARKACPLRARDS